MKAKQVQREWMDERVGKYRLWEVQGQGEERSQWERKERGAVG